MKKYLSLFCVAILFVGCGTRSDKQTELVRSAVYAANDAADAGRFDLADNFLKALVQIVPPPKHRVLVKAIP